jgi:hypothetical protein
MLKAVNHSSSFCEAAAALCWRYQASSADRPVALRPRGVEGHCAEVGAYGVKVRNEGRADVRGVSSRMRMSPEGRESNMTVLGAGWR